MAEQGEVSTTAETFRSGNVEGEGSRVGHGVSDGAEKKAEVNQGAGDPSTSHREPFGADRFDKGKSPAPGISPAQDGTFRGFSPMPAMQNWPFNPSTPGAGFDFSALGPLVPVLLPGPFPPCYPIPGQDQQPLTGGIFAVPVMPMFGAMGTVPQGGFIPLSFNIPPVPPPAPAEGQTHAATSPAARPAEAGRAAPQAGVRDAAAPNGLRQRHVPGVGRARQGGPPRPGDPQRQQQQVVRRFQVGFQLDLLLILKLAVVVIVFNQDGTKDRLVLLLLLAGIVYLYQTGALAPILRWISLSAQRAMMPPQQPLPGAEAAPNAEGVGAPPPNVRDPPVGPQVREDTPPGAPAPVGAAGQGEGPPGRVGVQEQGAEQAPQNPNWWGFFKELQMIVVGFLTSLLPGFQHVE